MFAGEIRWSFQHSSEPILKQEFSETLPRASIQDLGVILMGSGYEVIVSEFLLYLFLYLWHFDFLFLSSFG